MPGARGRNRRALNGVILLNKPTGLSSQQAVSRVRHLLNAAKAGHTGTLDPAADGLLPVCLGEATKFTQRLLDADKRYVARVRLGVVTTTGDAEGGVIRTCEVHVSRAELDAAVARFRGEIEQCPPMYSALKYQGKPLYEYARKGIEIERKVRVISLYESQVIDFKENIFELSVHCSKGTYIRVLAMDIGEALGCGASLVGLTRTSVGDLSLQSRDVCSLNQLDEATPEARDAWLQPVDSLVTGLPMITFSEAEAARLLLGQRLRLSAVVEAGLNCAYAPNQRFLGLVEVSADGLAAPKRMLGADVQSHANH